jgi:type IV secretory pathway VirB2 component (pilin)
VVVLQQRPDHISSRRQRCNLLSVCAAICATAAAAAAAAAAALGWQRLLQLV